MVPLALLSPVNNESCWWGRGGGGCILHCLIGWVSLLWGSSTKNNNKKLAILAHGCPWREYLMLGLWVQHSALSRHVGARTDSSLVGPGLGGAGGLGRPLMMMGG